MKLLQVLMWATLFASVIGKEGERSFTNETSIKVTEGDPLEISCKTETGDIVSNPEPTVSWQMMRNGSVLPLPYPRIAVDKEGKLHFAYVNVSDGADDTSFVCSAQNARLGQTVLGSETRLIATKLAGDIPSKKPELSYSNAGKPPYPGARLYPVDVIKGEKVDLYCIFKGYPDFNITWTTNRIDDPLPPEGITLSNGNTKLTVDTAKLPDGILLTCTGENVNGVAESLYDVIIQEPPVFFNGPLQVKNVSKTVGEEVYFHCDVSSRPSAKIEWLVDNELVSGKPPDPRMTIDSKGNFHLKDLKETDNQVVTCRATQTLNSQSFTIFRSGYINVFRKNNITLDPHGNLTQARDDGWEFPWWLWLLILAAIILLIVILCCICCCCCCKGQDNDLNTSDENHGQFMSVAKRLASTVQKTSFAFWKNRQCFPKYKYKHASREIEEV